MTIKFDVERARAETRACENLIHFNNAGASLMPMPVADALHHYLQQEENIGGYETAEAEQTNINHFYDAAGQLLNCSADEIAFVENATRAWDMAFYAFKLMPGDKILTTLSEYGSNVIAYNQQVKRHGAELVFVPNDESGQIDTDALADLIDKRVKLISISHIPTGSGLVNPAGAVGRIAGDAGIPFILDACQSVGHIPLDVTKIGCDVLCGTGRKYLRGPRGTGFLYVRRGLIEKLEPPILDQHAATLLSPTEYIIRDDAKRFENWEQYFAGKAALGKAIDYALSWGIDEIKDRVYALATILRSRLAEIKGITIADQGVEKCGIVTFTTDRSTPGDIKKILKQKRINVSVSDGSGSLVSFSHRGLKSVVRASLHYYNTETEVDIFMETLEKTVGR
ncbi:MAG: aminotransferase class V-fold PLP-dependent enzyme [Desulfobacteraceae bacterium]|nr:aminotransferase class V-fold PLP-dependent enzyme [Desulfobacteraceae bacterium]